MTSRANGLVQYNKFLLVGKRATFDFDSKPIKFLLTKFLRRECFKMADPGELSEKLYLFPLFIHVNEP